MSPERPGGAFVAVVGPSGAGKDTLMSRAAHHPELRPEVGFVRRVVTRDALVISEDHDTLDEVAFGRAKAEGVFALTWAAHGLHYALPRSVSQDLRRGRVVVANLSRRSLNDAAMTFGCLWVVEVTAAAAVLLARLEARGRESRDTILDRLRRQVVFTLPASATGHLKIDNSGDVSAATDVFVAYLNALCERST